MKYSRFSEEQIIAILKEKEAGVPTANICRRHGVSNASHLLQMGDPLMTIASTPSAT
jgi:hypothetical protein